MADYQRILSYLYRYEKTEKKECLGFVKAEQKPGSLKLTIQIDDERLLQGMELKLCFYEKQGENWQVWNLDTVVAQEHREELHLIYYAEQLPTGFKIKGQSGVLLYYQDSFYYGSVWIGEELPTDVLEPLRWHKVMDSAKSASETEKKDLKKDISGEMSNRKLEETEELNKKRNVTVFDEGLVPAIEKTESEEELPVSNKIKNITENYPENLTIKEEKTVEEENSVPGELENIQKVVEKGIEDINSEDVDSDMNPIEEVEESVEIKETHETEESFTKVTEQKIEEESESIVDDFEKMWINSIKEKPMVDNIFNNAFYEGCKISVMDLEQFGEEAESLKSNQFLLKGYERYRHLLAGKVRYAGEPRYCIGVPGVYENREKYMAGIYQFSVFLPLTENRMKTGSFGYWLYLLK